MSDKQNKPTAAQDHQAMLVQHDLVELMNRLIGEGIAPAVVIAGAGSAIADTITSIYGGQAVQPWFAKQAEVLLRIVSRPN